jgi:hypothetical protein
MLGHEVADTKRRNEIQFKVCVGCYDTKFSRDVGLFMRFRPTT